MSPTSSSRPVRWYGPLALVLLCLSIALLVLHVRHINKRRNDIDDLAILLAPLKDLTPPGATIAFASDAKGAARKELYFKAQFVSVPRVLLNERSATDTTLVIDGDARLEEHYQQWRRLKDWNAKGHHAVLLVETAAR